MATRKDYIQLLLDAQTSNDDMNQSDDDSIDLTGMNLNKKLTTRVKDLQILYILTKSILFK